MTASEETVLSTIEAMYAASTDPGLWETALKKMASLLDACAMTLLHQHDNGSRFVFASAFMDPHLIELYDNYYWQHDPTLKATQVLPVGTFTSSDEVITRPEYERNEMVADLMLPNSLYRVAGSVLIRTEDSYASLGLHRPKKAREFDDIESLYMEIQPHLQRSLAINRKLASVTAERDTLAHTLDRVAAGIVVLDASGKVLRANRAASEMAASNDGFAMTSHGLCGATLAATNRIRGRVAEAAKAAEGAATTIGGGVSLERPSGRHPYALLVAPLVDPESLGAAHQGRVVVFVCDPERETSSPAKWLRDLYDLTCAESTVALALAGGASVTETADRLYVTRNTVRTHLQRALQKTGTSRQGELIRLVLAGPAGLVDPG